MSTAYAQEHEQEKKPEQKQQQAKPAQRPQAAKPAKQQAARPQEAKPAKQQAARPQQAKPAKQQAARPQQAKPAKQQERGQQQQVSSAQPAGGHGRIPDDRFRSSFGSGHTFHVNRSQFANGSGRFQYGGFWFNVVDPWPVGWLYTDAVYVDYINGGYFLCDPLHPGVYISINIG